MLRGAADRIRNIDAAVQRLSVLQFIVLTSILGAPGFWALWVSALGSMGGAFVVVTWEWIVIVIAVLIWLPLTWMWLGRRF